MDSWQRLVAAAITPDGDLLVVGRTDPTGAAFHELPGGRTMSDEPREATLTGLLREQLGAEPDIRALLHITAVHPDHTCYLYLVRIPAPAPPALAVPFTTAALAEDDLRPAAMAALLRGHAAAGTDLFTLPDLRPSLATPDPGHRTDFCVTIEADDHEAVEAVLGAWLPVSALRVRYRLLGSEVLYEDDTIYLYGYELTGPGPAGPRLSFQVEGEIRQRIDTAGDRLEALGRLCRDRGGRLDGEYVAVDADDTWLGEERTLRFEA